MPFSLIFILVFSSVLTCTRSVEFTDIQKTPFSFPKTADSAADPEEARNPYKPLKHVPVLTNSADLSVSNIAGSVIACEFYDPNICDPSSGRKCNTTEICATPEKGKRNHCYALWANSSTDGFLTLKKGCWLQEQSCIGVVQCVETKPHPNYHYCCCDSNLCNRNTYWEPKSTPAPNLQSTTTKNGILYPDLGRSTLVKTMLYSLVPIGGLAIIIAVIFWMWRRHKTDYQESLPVSEPSPVDPLIENPAQWIGCRPIQLIEVKAHGRFGSVWKAQLIDRTVAVKMFPLQDKNSWQTEINFYGLPHVADNNNILRFIDAERRMSGQDVNSVELWLIAEYHAHGSLYDYLKGSLVTWPQLLNMVECISRGLSFLHSDLPASGTRANKPAVAHRDFKSKNVLVKSDLTVCIADFGLALTFSATDPISDTHGQVGTRRYMAPEVLEGAISFNRDSFLRIDMYACALVIWEIISRCSVVEGPIDEYRLPFEEEVGQHPSLEDMQDTVIKRKVRPSFKPHWLQKQEIASLCLTLEECWDHDAEARLSAGCVEERIVGLRSALPNFIDCPKIIPTSVPHLPLGQNGVSNILLSNQQSLSTSNRLKLAPNGVIPAFLPSHTTVSQEDEQSLSAGLLAAPRESSI